MIIAIMQIKWMIGIDEAGRGPLAGPVAVGALCVQKDFDWRLIPGVTDSKKLSHKNREAIFMRARQLQKEGELSYKVSMVSASVIDRVGITRAVQLGINRALIRLSKHRGQIPVTGRTCVKLDGLLKAPPEFKNQKTIIKGDQTEKVIGLASIMAKVTRDRYMIRMSKAWPYSLYGFEIHKGYGTKKHLDCIRKYGSCPIHRLSFKVRV